MARKVPQPQKCLHSGHWTKLRKPTITVHFGYGGPTAHSFFSRWPQLPHKELAPHSFGNVLFLCTDSVGVNRCRGKVGMAEPFLHQI